MLNFAKNEFNRLRFEWKNLNKEFNQVKKIHQIACSLFYKEILSIVKKLNIKDPFEQREEDKKIGRAEIFELDEIKQIYRNVALKTHPDKNRNGDDAFKKLVESKKDGKVNKLFDTARENNVEIQEISFDMVEKMEDEVNELNKNIQDMQLTIEWHWYHGNNKQKDEIINNIINTLKDDKKEKQV